LKNKISFKVHVKS